MPFDKRRIGQEELASFIGAEVEAVLARHNDIIRKQTRISAGRLSGNVAAAICLLSRRQHQAIDAMQDDLVGLAKDFVASLVATAAERFEAGDDQTSLEELHDPAEPRRIDRPTGGGGEESTLGSMMVEDWAGPVAGPTALETQFGIARSTLYRWQRRNEVVALLKGGRKYVFPLAQFVDGRPAVGIRDVLSVIGHSRLAWFWLTHPCSALGDRNPIDLLRIDNVADVVWAATGYTAVKPS